MAMTTIRIGWCLALALLAAALPVRAGETQTPSMPPDLIELLRAHACEPVSKFYQRPGLFGPDYVISTTNGASASIHSWCQKLSQGRVTYLMVSQAIDDSSSFKCAAQFLWWNFPGGLSIQLRKQVDLSKFSRLSDPKRKGPKTRLPDTTTLVSSYDGNTEVFICYQGQWYFEARD